VGSSCPVDQGLHPEHANVIFQHVIDDESWQILGAWRFSSSRMERAGLIRDAPLSPQPLLRHERCRQHRTADELELKARLPACISRPPTNGSASMHSAFMRQRRGGDGDGGGGVLGLFQYRKRYIDFVGHR
jgi:hypothetical protein